MKKRLLAFALFLTLSVSVFAGCSSKSDNGAQKPEENTNKEVSNETEKASEGSEKTDIAYDKIVVGLDDTFAPMGFRDDKGELTGFDVELAKAVSESIGIPFEFQPINWSMKETELNNKNIDLIWNGYTITDERKEKVLFTQPYLNNKQIVVTMADSDINSLSDLSGKVVAAQAESSAIDAIDSKPEVKDTFGELVTFQTNNECLMDLEAGRSNAVVADEVLLRYYISQKGAEKYKVLDEGFGDEEYGIGARKDDENLVEAINKALQELKSNGKGKEISEKWFGADILQ